MANKKLGPGGRPPVEQRGYNRRIAVNLSKKDFAALELILTNHDPAPFDKPSYSTAVRFAINRVASAIAVEKVEKSQP